MRNPQAKTMSIALLALILFISATASVGIASATINVITYNPTYDFTVSAQSSAQVCACSSTTDILTITNTGTFPAIFSVSTNNKDAQVSNPSFQLGSDKSIQVPIIINADCNIGTSDLIITVSSNLGTTKTLTQSLSKTRCQNIALWLGKYVKDSEPCQQKSITIYVQNVGAFSEEYTLASNYDNYVTYNANRFVLEPNQIAIVNATVRFECSMYGVEHLAFTTSSIKNRLTATIPADIYVAQDYDYSLSWNNMQNLTSQMQVCNRVTSTKVPFTIQNSGKINNTYTFDIRNLPPHTTDDITPITLAPGESHTFTIDFDTSTLRYEHNTYDLKIIVHPKYGDIVKIQEALLNLHSCYEQQVIIENSEGNSARNPLNACQDYLYQYTVVVANNGIRGENYALSLSGNPTSATLTQNTTTVPAGQNRTVGLNIIGPAYNTIYNIKASAVLFNGISTSDNIWVKSYDSQACHAITTSTGSVSVNDISRFASINIKNIGIVPGRYVVYWNGSNILSLNNTIISLNTSQSSDIILAVNTTGLVQGSYNGTLVIESLDSSASYDTAVRVVFKDRSIFEKAFDYLALGTLCRQVTLYQIAAIIILIILAILFAIFGPHYPYTFKGRLKKKMPIAIFLIEAFLIVTILVILFSGFPKTTSQIYNLTTNASELRFEWLANSNYVLDASQFFHEADNVTLHYNITGLKNIKTSVDGSRITLYPDLDWSGTEHANITAYNQFGGSVTSPQMTFNILGTPRKSMLELYNIYCAYINLAILLIVLLMIFILIFVAQKRRTRK